MKKYFFLLTTIALAFTSCSKDNPTPEVDQEEIGTTKLVFTPVEKNENNGQVSYTEITGQDAQTLNFVNNQAAADHLHLHVGETYKVELKTTNFAGLASQHTFLERASNHQAFLLGSEAGSLDFVYGDDNVGVTFYITILKEAETKVLRYVMRHLNNGVKERIKASDWNNENFTQFTGANDLDLKFEAHFVSHDEHNDHHDH